MLRKIAKKIVTKIANCDNRFSKCYQCNKCKQYWDKWLCVRSSPIMNLSAKRFHKISLNVAQHTFGNLEIRTLTPKKIKNETNDNLKLVGENPSHLQGFAKQKNAAVHLNSFFG